MSESRRVYSYVWTTPALAIYLTLFVLPLLYGLYSSLTDWTMGVDAVRFVGLANFRDIFGNPELVGAVGNTFLYTVIVVVLKNLAGFFLAVAVNVRLSERGAVSNVFRMLFYMPAVISTIVIGIVFTRILHPDGLLNQSFRAVGLGFLARDWLIDTRIVVATIACVSVWQWAGYHMAIYLAGMQSIPKDYYEAAIIDGAGSWHRLLKVTVPLLAPSISINVMLALIGGLKGFSEVYALTNGGPGHASQVLTTEVLAKFGEGRWGLGTALNTLLFVLVAVVCVPLLLQMRKQEIEE